MALETVCSLSGIAFDTEIAINNKPASNCHSAFVNENQTNQLRSVLAGV